MLDERHTIAEWEQILSEENRKVSLQEFQLIELYQMAGSVLRIERMLVEMRPMVEKQGHVSDMLSVWLVATVRSLRANLPAAQMIPPYPDTLVGRMDLKDAQMIHELEIERRRELIAAAEQQAVGVR